MQYQHTKRELEMAELIEGSERDRRRLAELLDGIRVGPGVDAMADGMREAVWADVRSRIRRRGIRMRIVRYAAAAAVMAGVVCGSWFMGGRRTESRLVAAAGIFSCRFKRHGCNVTDFFLFRFVNILSFF